MEDKIDPNDLLLFSELDLLYNQQRLLQAESNNMRTPCIGSGRCCNIGLQIPMLECAFIAFNIARDYYRTMESFGPERAHEEYTKTIEALVDRMHDENWKPYGKGQDKVCAFYKDGCSIYEYRPSVCRHYGTTIPVDDFCPRERLEDGTIDMFKGPGVKRMVDKYQELVDRYNTLHENEAFVVYMPLGVLKCLLSDEEMRDLAQTTDPKFWQGHPIYDIYFIRLYKDAVKESS